MIRRILSQTAVLSNGLRIELTEAPVYKQYYFALHKYQLGQTMASNRPETAKNIINMHYSDLTESYQRGWLRLNSKDEVATPKEIQAWLSYTNGASFITNFKGTDTFANYITGERLDREDPGLMSIFLLGNVLCGREVVENNILYLHPDTMDGNKSFDATKTREKDPEIIHAATIYTTRQLPDRSLQVNPFAQAGIYGRVTGRSVLYPFVSRFRILYPMKYLLKLPLGMIPLPNPYNPPMMEVFNM